MSYCPTCGRERTSDVRFCGGCGRDFGAGATAGSTVAAGEPDVEPVRWDPSGEEPPSTVTVLPASPLAAPATVSVPAEYMPPGPPAYTAPAPPAYVPPGPPAEAEDMPPGAPRGGWRTLWVVAAVIVLLAAGGGTYVLVKHLKGQPTAAGAPTPTARATVPTTQPASTLVASPQASASQSPSPSASPSASPSPSVVSLGPAVTNASPQVEVVLSHYFQGINRRNYAEWESAETAKGIQNQPKSSFDAGYATTTDTGMTLESLTSTGGGDLTATVVFTSRQSPSDSVDSSACNNWTLNLYLVPSGAGYLIAPAPPDYQPSYTDC